MTDSIDMIVTKNREPYKGGINVKPKEHGDVQEPIIDCSPKLRILRVLCERNCRVSGIIYMGETEYDKLTEVEEIVFYELPKLDNLVREYLEGRGSGGALEGLAEEEKWCIYIL